jgi:gas vesicle protein
MKNPFVKQDHTLLIASIAIGALAASAITYLYLTDSGAAAREEIKKTIKKQFKKTAADVISKKTKLSKKAAKVVADHVVK